jgi:hypothetical protein
VGAVVDTGMHPPERIQAYREKAEAALLNGLTPRHNDNARAFVGGSVERLRALSDQLALQVYTTMVPVEQLIREMPSYYALRSPSEVGAFHWTLDAKSDKGITTAETYWRQLVCPYLQTIFPGFSIWPWYPTHSNGPRALIFWVLTRGTPPQRVTPGG